MVFTIAIERREIQMGSTQQEFCGLMISLHKMIRYVNSDKS